MGNLTGLALGFAIGGAGLAVLLPTAAGPDPPVAQATQPPPPEPPPQIAAMPQATRPIELPRVSIGPQQPAALPNIIHPDTPPGDPRQPGSVYAGTGFFIASNGSLLTAAHVVTGCRQVRVASQLVKPTVAELVASDAKQDIALLRAAHVRPPALLSVGRPAPSSTRLFVLGYPASGGPLVPSEAWATLQNDRLQPAALADPRDIVWLEAPAINHGYSGGPILDPRNGEVVGIVRAAVDSTALHAVRAVIPESMVIGPGSGTLTRFLRQQDFYNDVAALISGDDALDTARRATVHVLCLP